MGKGDVMSGQKNAIPDGFGVYHHAAGQMMTESEAQAQQGCQTESNDNQASVLRPHQ